MRPDRRLNGRGALYSAMPSAVVARSEKEREGMDTEEERFVAQEGKIGLIENDILVQIDVLSMTQAVEGVPQRCARSQTRKQGSD